MTIYTKFRSGGLKRWHKNSGACKCSIDPFLQLGSHFVVIRYICLRITVIHWSLPFKEVLKWVILENDSPPSFIFPRLQMCQVSSCPTEYAEGPQEDDFSARCGNKQVTLFFRMVRKNLVCYLPSTQQGRSMLEFPFLRKFPFIENLN